MLIVCPSCATSYNLDLASLPPNGRKVRCVRCRTVWHARPNQRERLLAAAAAIAPDGDPVPDPAFAPLQPDDHPGNTVSEAQAPVHQAHEAASDQPGLVPAAAQNVSAGDAPGDHGATQAPPIAPIELADGPPIDAGADGQHEDIETYAARHQPLIHRRRSWHWPLSQLQSAIVALLIVEAALIAWRNDVVRVLPQTASFYAMIGLGVNLRGLAFEGLTTATEQREGVPVLVVEGSIVNDTSQTAYVPPLRLAARNAAGEEIYSWTAAAPRQTLPSGQTVAFRTRLASPPSEIRDVLVRFATRRDMLAATP